LSVSSSQTIKNEKAQVNLSLFYLHLLLFTNFMRLSNIFFVLFSIGLIACKSASKPDIHFYHWKGVFKIDSLEQTVLKKVSSKKLYLRFFDVDYQPEQGAVPIGITQMDSIAHSFDEVIATVFITNRTMLQIPSDKIMDLAEKMMQKIEAKSKLLPLRGIQLDCDWSEKSQRNYFTLCSEIGKRCKAKNLELSATIRLHQYKYAHQTGIPPVDRGVLMIYNVGDLDGKNTQNSILDLAIIEEYLAGAKKYDLQLDIALPLFSWAVVQRMGKTVALLNTLTEEDLQKNLHLKKIQKNLYKVIENHYFGGRYLYEDDLLRWESVRPETLEKLCQQISKKIQTQEIIFYHLDSKILQKYETNQLKNLANYWL
jgi:hypothetical protein